MNAQHPTTPALSRRAALGAAGATVAAVGAAGAVAGASPAAATRGGGRPVVGRAGRRDLHVMTFNIRMDNETATAPGQPDYWPERAPVLQRLLALEQPTLLGVQEAEFNQLGAVEAGLGRRYGMVGFGRDGGSGGEYSAVFYDAERLEVLEWDQFWLSDTPDVVGSATWGNSVTRIVTWARVQDRRTGAELLHVNSHFDHQSENARVRSAEAVRALVAEVALPAVVTADFNAAAGRSAPYDVLVGDGALRDTWDTAGRHLTDDVGTFPNYRPTTPGGDRIDWVLATPDVSVLAAALNPFTWRGRYPSDHLPVQALVRV